MFELALKSHLRIKGNKGLLTTEQLYDLSLEELNDIAKNYYREKNKANELNFLNKTSEQDNRLELIFDIVIHIIKDKQNDMENRAKEKEILTKKQHLATIIAEKKAEKERNKSIEELESLYNKL